MFESHSISAQEIEENRIEGVKLHWRGEATQLQQLFDRLPTLAIERHNSLVEELSQRLSTIEQRLDSL